MQAMTPIDCGVAETKKEEGSMKKGYSYEYATLRNDADGLPVKPLWPSYESRKMARSMGKSLQKNYTIWCRKVTPAGWGKWEILERH